MRFTKLVPAAALLGACSIALGWGGYATIAWLGYGIVGIDRRPDPLLDRFMPVYEIAERHETRVAAPAAVTYAAACAFDVQQSAVVRAIFRGREVLLRTPRDAQALPTQLVPQTLRLGWRVLAESPGQELVMGAVTQPWQPHVVFEGVAPSEFASFDRPGYAQIAWTLAVDSAGAQSSVFRTVTRVRTTDAAAREKFRRYWAVYSPGILLIRSEALRVVRTEAERTYRAGGGAAVARCVAR